MSGQGLMLEISRKEVGDLREQNEQLQGTLRSIAEQLKQWAIQSGRRCSNCDEDESVEYYAGRKDAFSDAYQLIPEDSLTVRG